MNAGVEIPAIAKLCCPHRMGDHQEEALGRAVRLCTVPGCACLGYRVRKKTDRGGRPDRAKGRAL